MNELTAEARWVRWMIFLASASVSFFALGTVLLRWSTRPADW